MAERPSDDRAAPLRLEPFARIERPLSMPEYYHASIGCSPKTLEIQRESIFILEDGGIGFDADRWREAVDKACAANPGTRLRLVGDSFRSRWVNDGPPARLRVVEQTDWDGMSSDGCGFIRSEPLSLQTGPTVEVTLVNHAPRGRMVIMRTPHAVMDGRGSLHFLAEIFRALRGDALIGSNAGFSDVDLMLAVGARSSLSKPIKTQWLTGAPQGHEQGDDWRRIRLHTEGRNILARIAVAMADYMHQHSDLPALIAVPADLRRHVPGLVSTANFTNMLLVRLDRGDGVERFRHTIDELRSKRMDAHFAPWLSAFKLLPRSLLDRAISRTASNFHKKRAFETAVISNLGRIDPEPLSFGDFRPDACFALPVAGSVFSVLSNVGDRSEMILNMPRTLSSNGRFDDFVAYLHARLAETENG